MIIGRILKFLKQNYELIRPYGRLRLAGLLLVIIVQSFVQLIGVGSIFPFLSLVSDPLGFRSSKWGSKVIGLIPDISDDELMLIAGVFAIVALIVSNVFMLLGEYIRVRYINSYAHWLRMRLARRILSNPYGYFVNYNTGVLIKKITGDVGLYSRVVLESIIATISRFFIIIVIVAGLLIIAPWLTIYATLGLGAYYVIIFAAFGRFRKKMSESVKSANRGLISEVQQMFGGIKPIKVHSKESSFIKKIEVHSKSQALFMQVMSLLSNAPRFLLEPMVFGGMVAFIVVMIYQGKEFSLLLPKLSVLAFGAYRILPNLQQLYFQISNTSLNYHAFEEVYEEFNAKVNPIEKNELFMIKSRIEPFVWSNSISLDSLFFGYNRERYILENLNIVISKDRFIAIVGETGSGKSTLIDLLLGLYSPTHGDICVDGRALASGDIRSWQASIGYVPQDIFLLDDTVAANIAFGVHADEVDLEQVKKVARIAQIDAFIENELQHGYESQVGERGVRLSGGQRQRIGLARALYHEPTTLILDEATSALDQTTEAALMEAIEGLHGSITLIAIAHRLTTIEKADCIIELKNGGVSFQGKPSEYFEKVAHR